MGERPPEPPCRDWAYKWIAENQQIHLVSPTKVEPDRVEACSAVSVAAWFETMAKTVNPTSFAPELTFNYDETMLSINPKSKKVVTSATNKTTAKKSQTLSIQHISLGVCVSASGAVARPLVVLPMKQLPSNIPKEVFSFFAWSGSDSGWITCPLFENWVSHVFLPFLKQQRSSLDPNSKEPQPALLWLDGHPSRKVSNSLKLLAEHNVTAATIPSHTSHILQPLDNGFFRTFKSSLSQCAVISNDLPLPEKRLEMLKAAQEAMYDASKPSVVRRAWARTGLYPWSPDMVLKNKGAVNDCAAPEPPKRQAININSRVLTEDNFISLVESDTQIKKEKYRAKIEAKKEEKQNKKEDESESETEKKRKVPPVNRKATKPKKAKNM